MRSVHDLLPNMKCDSEVLLFHHFQCIEHYPYFRSEMLGRRLCDCLDLLGIYNLPDDVESMFIRFRGYNITYKNRGAYDIIIFPKNLINCYYEQDPKNRN